LQNGFGSSSSIILNHFKANTKGLPGSSNSADMEQKNRPKPVFKKIS